MLEVLHQGLQQAKWNHQVVAYLQSKKRLLLKIIELAFHIQFKGITLLQIHIFHLMRHIQQVRIHEMEQLTLNG